jgi:hypothetical protein
MGEVREVHCPWIAVRAMMPVMVWMPTKKDDPKKRQIRIAEV